MSEIIEKEKRIDNIGTYQGIQVEFMTLYEPYAIEAGKICIITSEIENIENNFPDFDLDVLMIIQDVFGEEYTLDDIVILIADDEEYIKDMFDSFGEYKENNIYLQHLQSRYLMTFL